MCFSLQRILGVASLDEVLDRRYVNPQNIIHNMTKVNKHGVVTLDDKTSKIYLFIYLFITRAKENHYRHVFHYFIIISKACQEPGLSYISDSNKEFLYVTWATRIKWTINYFGNQVLQMKNGMWADE